MKVEFEEQVDLLKDDLDQKKMYLQKEQDSRIEEVRAKQKLNVRVEVLEDETEMYKKEIENLKEVV